MIRRRALVVGLALVAAYLLAAGITIRVSGHHVRPLFEGIGPSPTYQWVHPPPEFAAGNTKPHPTTSDLVLGLRGSAAAGVFSSDGQIVLNLGDQAVPPHPGDSRASAVVTPLDPATLGAFPAGLSADGNAYRVTITYRPSNLALAALAKPGNVVLQVPSPATAMLFSSDGKTWRNLASVPVGGTAGIGASLSRPGYYVAASHGSVTANAPSKSKTGSIVLVAVLTVALALVLGFAPTVIRRLRGRRDSRPRPGGGQRRR